MNKTDYMLANRDIALFMSDKPDNATYQTLCPVCLGGRTKEEKLYVTGNRDGYVFICFRANCGFKGRKGQQVEAGYGHREFVPRPFEQETVQGETEFERFAGITRLRKDTTTRVFECRGLDGALRGHVTRTADKQIKTYRLSPCIYYTKSRDSRNPLWIMEDPVSAAKLNYYNPLMVGLALLGTDLSNAVRDDICKYSSGTVYVALDPGAEEAAVSVINSLTARGINAVFVPLQKDIKDLESTEIRELVKIYTGI